MITRAIIVSTLALVAGCASGGKIAGSAQVPGVAGAVVTVTLSGPVVQATRTDAGGSYAFAGLADGAYTIVAAAPSTLEQQLRAEVVVSRGQTVTVPVLRFTAVGSISGTATRDGAPSGNAGIAVYVAGAAASATTDDAGNYTLSAVPIGMQKVTASLLGYAPAVTDPITVAPAKVVTAPPLSLQAASVGTGTLSGAVTLVGMSDASGVTVSLPGTSLTTTTDRAGGFSFAGVPTGTYPLQFAGGGYHETIPAVEVFATGHGFIADASDGLVYELQPLELGRATRLASGATNPLLSPDGGSILFTAGDNAVEAVPIVGGASVTLSANVLPLIGGTAPQYQVIPGTKTALVLSADHVLRRVALDGSSAVTIASGTYDFALSPDHQLLAYLANVSLAGTNIVSGAMSLVSSAGGTPVAVAGNVSRYALRAAPFALFSPSAARLFFVDTASALQSYDVASGQTTLIAAGSAMPVVVPGTEKAIRFKTALAPAASIAVLDLETLAVGVDLASDAGSTVFFSPDNSQLAYQTVYNATPFIGVKRIAGFLTAVATPAATPISNAGDNPSALAFSPDGGKVFYSCQSQSDHLYRMWVAPSDGSSAPLSLTATPSNFVTSMMTPDAKHVIWSEQTNSAVSLFSAATLPALAQVKATLLTSAAGALGGALPQPSQVSPDGQQILVPINVLNDAGTLAAIPVAGGTAVTIADGAVAEVGAFGYSPDGTRVYFERLSPLDTDPMPLAHTVLPTAYVAPATGGAATALLGRVAGTPIWAGNSTLLLVRQGTPKPFTIQDGVYAATLQ